jgi:adenylate cyclase
MATGDVKRKLTAIFSADVEGYSRLMGEDELATIETLTSYKETMGKLIRQYRGRVVDSTGDNLLAEFSSVVDAVQCAVEVQQVLGSKNETLPENRRMYFRIGINLGDVVEEGERIYGDGVNVAARVESLAEGGGISISGTAYDQLGKKLPLGYEYLGEQSVKNIEKPVRVYRVLTEAEAAGKVIGEEKPKPKQWRWAAFGAVAVLILGAGALAIWNFYLRPAFEPASVEKMAFPLPEKPSIAVLPFDNLSGDPEQEYIADGITENITTALSKIPEMFVIARTSTFAYKGKAAKLHQVAEDLGVRYVLEGSIQKADDRIRVTAQLIDALAGQHLWSEKYDKEVKDFFQIQDEITHKIAVELQVKLTHGEQARKWYGTMNFEAWGYTAKGVGIFENYTRANNEKARELFEKALKIDPDSAFAWVMLAWTHFIDVRLAFTKTPSESIKKAIQFAKKAQAIDDTIPDVHNLLGSIYLIQRQHEKAIAEGQKSIELDPNSALSYALYSQTMYYAGDPDEAIASAEEAIRLCPNCPAWYLIPLGRAYRLAGRYQDALEVFEKLLERAQKGEYPLYIPHQHLAITYSMMGQSEKAQIHLAETQKFNSKYSLEYFRKISFFKDPADLERHLNALRKAGLTDEPLLPLPDKPSIAVLPFVNMSGDPEQEYFSDGITEEIITALSKTPKLFVIARTSSFKYKNKEVDVRTVGRELGVRYVLEGSVRKAEDRVRITAQLVDAQTGNHLWAERYDRDPKYIFAVQDEITKEIITALQVKLARGEQATVEAKGTDNLDAYIKFLQAKEHWWHFNKEENTLARQMAKQAIDLDPQYPGAHCILAWTHVLDVWYKSSKSPKESLKKAFELAQKSIALDDSYAPAYSLLGYLFSMKREHDKAIALGERAVVLNPNYADGYGRLARSLNFADRCEESITLFKKALRLNPFPPSAYYYQLAGAYNCLGKYEDAIEAGKKAVHLEPNNLWAHLTLVLVYNGSGRVQEARAEAAEVLRIDSKFSVEHFAKTIPLKNQGRVEGIVEALRKAGLK